MTRIPLLCAAALLAFEAAAQPAGEAAWPQRSVRLIAPFPPGSTADVIARLMGQRLAARTGQQFIVENRVGASGNIGSDMVAKSAPDGYTLGIGTTSTHAVAVALSRTLPYDPVRDFTPVTMIGSSPYVLVAYPGLAKSVADLVVVAREKPGALNYGSAGTASLAHLASELFAARAGVKLTHVPYKSTAQSVVDLVSGRLDMQMATIAPSLSSIRSGQLRALAVTGPRRVAALPDVPTLAEAGVPGYEASLWFALVAPAGLPRGVLARANREATEILGTAEMKEALSQQGFEAEPGSPEVAAARIRSEVAKWREAVQQAGIKPE
jgi:tripartite-type tricarboxylate transporter receptor subunit TctC